MSFNIKIELQELWVKHIYNYYYSYCWNETCMWWVHTEFPCHECALTASIYVWIESVWRESGHLTFLWTMKKPDLTVVSALLVYTGFNGFPLLPGQLFLGQLNLNKISSRFSLAYSVRCDVVVMWIADCVHFGLLQCVAVCGRWPWVFVSSLPPCTSYLYLLLD